MREQVFGRPCSTIRPRYITATSSQRWSHDREVVADQDVAEAELLLQVLQQVEHLRLHRDVERADRLVGDDQLRLRDQRARDRDALALAAGEFVRVLVHVGVAQARPAAAPSATRSRCVGAVDVAQRGQRLGDDARDGLARIERAVGVLEHHLEIAPRAAQLVARQRDAGRGPSSDTEPDVGRSSAITSRASVDLPEPDSPTMPRLRPASTAQLTPLSACTSPGGREQLLARQRVALHEVLRRRAAALGVAASAPACVMRARSGRLGHRDIRPDAAHAMAGADLDRRRQRRAACGRSTSGQRSAKGQPGGRSASSGTRAGDRRQPRALARAEPRPGARTGPACRDGPCGANTVAGRPALDDACRHTSPSCAARSRAITPRSCEIRIIAMPRSATRSRDQVEDLALDGDVERGGRLVGDQQVGLAGERHGDGDALALAAGELVRIGVDAPAPHRECRRGRASAIASLARLAPPTCRGAAAAARRPGGRSCASG